MRRVLGFVLLLTIGCAPVVSMTPSVVAMYEYRGYGDLQPDRDRAVLERAKSADDTGVLFLQENPPEGFEITAHGANVKPGYEHRALGKLAYASDEMMPKAVLVERVKKVAAAAGGDAAVGIFIATDPDDYNRAKGVEAVILKIDPRFKTSGGGLGVLAGPGAPPKGERTGEAVYAVFPLEVSLASGPTDLEVQSLYEVYTVKMSEGGLRIVPTSEIRARLGAQKLESYQACYDDSCQIELGKELAANAVVRTTIAPLGDECVLSAKVFDLRSETTLPGSTRRTSCELKQLADALESLAHQLAR